MEIVRSQRESSHAATSTMSAKLSFYRSAPALKVRLEDFELYGIDRLRVLQGISDGLPRGKRPEEMEKLVLRRPLMSEFQLPYKVISHAEFETVKEKLNQVTHSIGQPLNADTLFFKAPFEEVPELFVGRRVFLQKCFAYVAMHQAVSLVATQFRSNLSKCLVLTNRCDRILWFGRGLSQLSYVQGESKFSDHRPVFSTFTAEVEMANYSQCKNVGYCSSRVERAWCVLPAVKACAMQVNKKIILRCMQVSVSLAKMGNLKDHRDALVELVASSEYGILHLFSHHYRWKKLANVESAGHFDDLFDHLHELLLLQASSTECRLDDDGVGQLIQPLPEGHWLTDGGGAINVAYEASHILFSRGHEGPDSLRVEKLHYVDLAQLALEPAVGEVNVSNTVGAIEIQTSS
ncbi:hypothetical protein ZIOFF_013304 [Zingiber officinale]|uniref:Uncharacterized protein n=1 Tax=Zingiber officinale TaxID=94328 RepID=A0A8J5H9S0_ZINOF|nr:hypothetical protein ZIOFF_013304 [Zingiber officinale]